MGGNHEQEMPWVYVLLGGYYGGKAVALWKWYTDLRWAVIEAQKDVRARTHYEAQGVENQMRILRAILGDKRIRGVQDGRRQTDMLLWNLYGTSYWMAKCRECRKLFDGPVSHICGGVVVGDSEPE